MDGTSDHLFASATLAQNQDGMRAAGGFGNDAIELLHLGGAPDIKTITLPRLKFLAQHPVLSLEFEMVGNALQQDSEFVGAEWLGDVLVSAVLHRLHCRLHRAVAGDDDHERFRVLGLDPAQSFEAARARQAKIKEDGVDIVSLQQTVGVFRRVRDMSSETKGQRDFATGIPNRALVVDDEEVQKVSGQYLRRSNDGAYSC